MPIVDGGYGSGGWGQAGWGMSFFYPNQSESTSIVDITSTSINVFASVSESASGNDSVASVVQFISAVQEVVIASEQFNAFPTEALFGNISESISCVDVVSSYSDKFVSVSEAVIAEEQVSSLLNLFCTIDEVVYAAEEVACSAVFQVSIIEQILGQDVLIGRKLWELIDDGQDAQWNQINTTQNQAWSVMSTTDNATWQVINTTM